MFVVENKNLISVTSDDFHLFGCILSREALRTIDDTKLPSSYKIDIRDLADFIESLDALGHNIQSVILARDPKVELRRVCEIPCIRGNHLAINNNGKLQIYKVEQSLRFVAETYCE